jgi:tetratricopeptide (TPR) repeat protein
MSEAYLSSVFAAAEWQAAWRADPGGAQRKLLVLRLEDCELPGLLGQVVSEDLFDVDREEARGRVLAAVAGERRKPRAEPAFPRHGTEGVEPAFPPELPAVWNVPPRLAWFVGRQDQFEELDAALRATSAASVCALEGMGGVGKTALAVEYAYRRAGRFDVVWWVAAENPDLVGEQLSALGAELGLPRNSEPGIVLGALRRKRHRWLLVLDNVDQPSLVGPLRPTDGRGRLLVTSRRRAFDGLGPVVDVLPFERAESTTLLTGRRADLSLSSAAAVADLVGDLPIAIEQAAAFLRRTDVPVDEYAALLAATPTRTLARADAADRPGQTVAGLWDVSVQWLLAEQPAAVELLELLAWCSPEPVPLGLFTSHPDLLPDGRLKFAAADPLAWVDTVSALVGYSLARRDGDSLTVHRLVQAAVRDRATAEETLTATWSLVRLLAAALPTETADPATWPRWRQLVPHVLASLDRAEHIPDDATRVVSRLNDAVGRYLRLLGRLDTATALLERALVLDETHLGPDHPETLASRYNLACAWERAGRLADAVGLHEQVVIDTRRVLGPDHPATLASLCALATAYRSAGRVAEAVALHERNLAETERALGPDHPNTLTSQRELARTYSSAGRVADAIALLGRNLARQERVPGADHPDTLAARNDLAQAYESAGRVAEAIALHERNLAETERVLGPDHPNTLASRNNFALAYRSAGRVAEAVALHERNLTETERALGPGNPSTLTARGNLADTYVSAGRVAEAITLHERNLAETERTLGPDHPNTLTSQGDLARAYESAGRVAEAIALHERNLAGRERVFGPDHPNTLASRGNLAHAYESAGRVAEAVTLFERALSGAERVFGPDHPNTLIVRNNLAHAYASHGRVAEAVALYERNLVETERVLGTDHPITLNSRSNLADGWLRVGRVAEAVALLERNLIDTTRVFGTDHPEAATTRNDLAVACLFAERWEEATDLHERNRREQASGRTAPDVSDSDGL